MICMVELDQMFQCPGSFAMLRFDIMDIYGFEIDGCARTPAQKAEGIGE